MDPRLDDSDDELLAASSGTRSSRTAMEDDNSLGLLIDDSVVATEILAAQLVDRLDLLHRSVAAHQAQHTLHPGDTRCDQGTLSSIRLWEHTARVLRASGRLEESFSCEEKCVRTWSRLLPYGSPIADSHTDRFILSCNATALSLLQHNAVQQQSLQLLRKALSYTEPSTSASLTNRPLRLNRRSMTLNHIAYYFRVRAKYRLALQHAQEALAIDTENRDCCSPVHSHLNMCAILSSLGRHDGALQHAKAALQMARNLQKELRERKAQANTGMLDSYAVELAVITSYHNVACELEHLERDEAAIEHVRAAYAHARRLMGKDDALTSRLHLILCDLTSRVRAAKQAQAQAQAQAHRASVSSSTSSRPASASRRPQSAMRTTSPSHPPSQTQAAQSVPSTSDHSAPQATTTTESTSSAPSSRPPTSHSAPIPSPLAEDLRTITRGPAPPVAGAGPRSAVLRNMDHAKQALLRSEIESAFADSQMAALPPATPVPPPGYAAPGSRGRTPHRVSSSGSSASFAGRPMSAASIVASARRGQSVESQQAWVFALGSGSHEVVEVDEDVAEYGEDFEEGDGVYEDTVSSRASSSAAASREEWRSSLYARLTNIGGSIYDLNEQFQRDEF